MTTQPQPEALRLADAMEQRVIPRWVHATGETPRQSGFAADAECQAAAAELRRLHAECEALSSRCDRLDADLDDCRDKRDALHAECEALRADRDSWERQCSDRVDDAVEFLRQRDEARAECEALRATQSDTLLRLLCDLRFALGDNGARMQHDLVEYARGMRADAERWREFRTFVVGKSTPGFLNGKPAAYMVLPAITVPRVGMTLDESIDAARAAKEQQG